MDSLVFVSSNEKKTREIEKILGFPLVRRNLDIPEIQSLDVEEVAKDKARKAYERIKKPVMVEDTGLYIQEWNGFPGALVKWVLRTLGREKICKLLSQNREALAKTCVCLFNGKEMKTFTGEIQGEIAEKPGKSDGFGWDPVFIPSGYEKPFSELGEEKDRISMRRRALEKAKIFLERNPEFLN